MSEKLQSSGEQLPNVEANVESEKNLERLRDAAKNAEHEPQTNIEAIQKSIENQAISGKEHNVGDHAGEQSKQSFGIDAGVKSDGYKKSLRKIRSQLNQPERVLSKIIHQPTVEATSNALAKTVARPSAFLGGSLGALIGSAVLLYVSKHYGFSYNYAVIFVLFAGGFAVGIVLELFFRLIVRRRKA